MVTTLKKFFVLAVVLFCSNTALSQWDLNTTPDYVTLIKYLKQLDQQHKELELYVAGPSDIPNLPIYVCIINGAQDSSRTFEKAKNSTTVLINNAIHAGEPDGVNASLLWIDQWIKAGKPSNNLPLIAFIPAYNVGGMINRSSTSRANQLGPEEYGFRGNSQNLDLNRDFIKMDSPNAQTFARLYHALNPDVFVDNHVSNGADYQYTLTYISSLKERLAPSIQSLTYDQCIPNLTEALAKKGTDLFPYMELKNEIPEEGIVAFNDLPRYAMGYATLFHSLSFTVETHMLKPFPDRVKATLQFLEVLFDFTAKNSSSIEASRVQAINWLNKQERLPILYKITDKSTQLDFKGFEAKYKKSVVTGLDRLYYDRSSKTSKKIPYFNDYKATDTVNVPSFYVIHPSAAKTIDWLKTNNVQMVKLLKDSSINVSSLEIVNYETGKRPYEAHYLHSDVKLVERSGKRLFPAGTILVKTEQSQRNFLLNTLNPKSEDSYFNWNFYDSHLQEKEYFSSYVFEDMAVEILKGNPELARRFLEKQKDPEFQKDQWAQLFYIYQNSPYFEKMTFNVLPVFEVE